MKAHSASPIRSLGLIALLALAAWALMPGRANAYIYWSDWAGEHTSIGRANLGGSHANPNFIRDITPGSESPGAMTVDRNHIYWASDHGPIGRANVDGSHLRRRFITETGYVTDVAVDREYIYWGDQKRCPPTKFGRADPEGRNLELPWLRLGSEYGCGSPSSVAVDAEHFYWANWDGAIGRANLDGSSPDPSFITSLQTPLGIVVQDDYIYWANNNGGKIGRASLDGTLVDRSFITGARRPGDVAVNSRHIYWGNNKFGPNPDPSWIGRADLDGSHVDQRFVKAPGGAIGIAVDGR